MLPILSQKWSLFITKIFSLHKPSIMAGLFGLFTIAILYEVAIYHVGLISSDYYEILGEKDKHRFIIQTLQSIGLIIAISLLKSLKDYLASYLHVEWRKQCTIQIHDQYFQNFAYFRLNVLNYSHILMNNDYVDGKHPLDNVDQRITQDVDRMFQMLSIIVPELLVWPFIVVFYWYKSQIKTGWLGPISCLMLFVIGSGINLFLINRVSHYVYQQERREGDFRFQHVRIRNNAESIAFISGEMAEHRKCYSLLDALITVQYRLIFRKFLLLFTTNLSDYFGSILSFIAIAVPLFAGHYDNLTPQELSKLISANAFVTIYLINCFTRLIDLSQNLSVFLGNYNRIIELNKWFLQQQQQQSSNNNSGNISSTDAHQTNSNLVVVDGDRPLKFDDDNPEFNDQSFYEMKNVTIQTPLRQTILENLNLIIKPRVNLIITGASGIGKTSILRSLKGIWPISYGSIQRNSQLDQGSTEVMFFTHKPLLTSGSVAEQILYPKIYERQQWFQNDGFRERVVDILKFLDLEECVLKRVNNNIHDDFNENWLDHLSIGEAQRFQMARIFFHRPRIVFLDESTTSLPEDVEEKIINELVHRYSITIVSCGHRRSLKRYHQMELRIRSSEIFELRESSKL
nr:lysosomal cobalamin transporter ABCD4-like [Dermatophagoides farinae]XP_046913247.1 lysosomal cobalamin transporter ABCD4-like [Dermatophagoides farinae]